MFYLSCNVYMSCTCCSYICCPAHQIDIPEQVDVVVSEPMGYMLFNERMLEIIPTCQEMAQTRW